MIIDELGNEIQLGELDQYYFGEGTHYEVYKKLGAHVATSGDKKGVYFAVWAPHAKAVSVVGEFNDWNARINQMKCLGEIGFYEAFVEEAFEGQMYKFLITTKKEELLYKADPYANYAQLRPSNASVVTSLNHFTWGDKEWLKKRETKDVRKEALSIYEVHLGSFKRHEYKEDNEDGFYNYKEMAHELADYVKEMGYTHVELMGIAEHPYDGSWGYQVTGYYAPTARYGTPADFMYMINYLHKNKIGVILDWVPAHFPKDEHGLANFDGEPLYEYADPKKGEHPDWGTKVFDYGKNEVRNFLIANALYWIEQFHIDGLRVDAVASMLYLDYGKKDGEWIANQYGGNKNLEAIEFFKHLNSVVLGRNHGTMMIAEESTAWPKVTGKIQEDGLGFTFKWNMGWMNDFLEYIKLDPLFKKGAHHLMTFAMTYANSENYILVLSHDEVVHLKRSILSKMPGDYHEKFANVRTAYTFMMGHPGKKLLFMGQEFGQIGEWSEKRALDWHLLKEDSHLQLQLYCKELQKLYKKYPAMYERDCETGGFEWINANDCDRSIFSFIRWSNTGKNNLLFVCNFTPVEWKDYRVGIHYKINLKLILNSDEERFGGMQGKLEKNFKAEKKPCDGREYSVEFSMQPYSAAVFLF